MSREKKRKRQDWGRVGGKEEEKRKQSGSRGGTEMINRWRGGEDEQGVADAAGNVTGTDPGHDGAGTGAREGCGRRGEVEVALARRYARDRQAEYVEQRGWVGPAGVLAGCGDVEAMVYEQPTEECEG